MLERTLPRLLLTTFVVALAACASAPAPTNVADTVARTPELSTLSKLIHDAGLADSLRGPGPFTVFAPSDAAFKSVDPKTLAELSSNKELLRSVLHHHVVPGRLSASEIKTGHARTVQGANLTLSKAGTFVTVEDAVVQTADVPITNGVVHIIDRVLMPPRR